MSFIIINDKIKDSYKYKVSFISDLTNVLKYICYNWHMFRMLKRPKILFSLLFALLLVILAIFIKKQLPEQQIQNFKKVATTHKITDKSPGLISTQLIKPQNLETSTALSPANPQDSDKPTKITDAAARAIILAYINAKKTGADKKELDKLAKKISSDFLHVSYNRFDKQDIHISKKTGKSDYTKSMRKALTPLTEVPEYELNTIAKIIKDKDSESLIFLKKDIRLYQKTIDNLLQLEVPEKAVVPHLALLNAYNKLLVSFQLINKSKDDIILTYPALRMFLEADAEIQSAFDALNLYAKY